MDSRCAALLCLGAVAVLSAPPPEVDVNTGRLRGKWTQTITGRTIASFEGVPYAQAPVGELRFRFPVPVEPWTGIKSADKPGSMCLQRHPIHITTDLMGSEDCLYINVYAPETLSRDKPLPVMVFIHGGGFYSGAGHLYGPEFLLDRDVVLVTLNYRLGPLGFLSTGDEVIPGNFGMKDMVLALHWVQDNIGSFGGDRDRVTIFGESAGGASVHYLTLSPLSKGLFHRAISMSGTAFAPWAFLETSQVKAQISKVAKDLGCLNHTSTGIRECLMSKTAEEVQGEGSAFTEWSRHPVVSFMIVAEPTGPDAFLDRRPSEAYAAGLVTDVPFMTGITSGEGCVASVPILADPQSIKELDERWHELAPLVFYSTHLPHGVNRQIFRKLREFYFGDNPISPETAQGLRDIFTDSFFAYSALQAAKLHVKANKSPVFFYEFAYQSTRSFTVTMGGKSANCVCHGDDLLQLFPMTEFSEQEPVETDRTFTNHMVDLFTNFAAEGYPTNDHSWKPVRKAEQPEYAYLSASCEVSMRQNFAPERMQLWEDLPANLALGSATLPRDEL